MSASFRALKALTARQWPGNRLEKLKGDRAGRWSIRINDQFRIVFGWKRGKRGMTPGTALLLARLFETTPEFWMNLQTRFDLWNAEREMA